MEIDMDIVRRPGEGHTEYGEFCEYGDCENYATGGVRLNVCQYHAEIMFEDACALGWLETKVPTGPKQMDPKEEALVEALYEVAEFEGQGVVYVLRFGTRLKVGFTTDYRRRLREIPHEEIIALFQRCTRRHEQHLLTRLSRFSVTGEWFVDCPEARAIIDSASVKKAS